MKTIQLNLVLLLGVCLGCHSEQTRAPREKVVLSRSFRGAAETLYVREFKLSLNEVDEATGIRLLSVTNGGANIILVSSNERLFSKVGCFIQSGHLGKEALRLVSVFPENGKATFARNSCELEVR
jgi:hypothetical protein